MLLLTSRAKFGAIICCWWGCWGDNCDNCLSKLNLSLMCPAPPGASSSDICCCPPTDPDHATLTKNQPTVDTSWRKWKGINWINFCKSNRTQSNRNLESHDSLKLTFACFGQLLARWFGWVDSMKILLLHYSPLVLHKIQKLWSDIAGSKYSKTCFNWKITCTKTLCWQSTAMNPTSKICCIFLSTDSTI